MSLIFKMLHSLTSRCALLPLMAGVLVVSAPVRAVFLPPEAEVVDVHESLTTLPLDFELIDEVLEKRAPDLGLTLRRQVANAIADEAGKAGYDPLLILAIIDVESDFSEEAISSVGAKGLMQIRPSTLHFLAQTEGIRLTREEVAADPALCVRLGIRYLRDLHSRFASLDLALMAYNAGPARIRAALKAGNVESFTFRHYPKLVQRDFQRFREGLGLGGDWALAQRQ